MTKKLSDISKSFSSLSPYMQRMEVLKMRIAKFNVRPGKVVHKKKQVKKTTVRKSTAKKASANKLISSMSDTEKAAMKKLLLEQMNN